MMLTDPRDALAEQSNFISYLVGLASLARAVHALASDGNGTGSPAQADDLVHLLLGVASVGDAIERLAESAMAPADSAAAAPSSASTTARWLR
jgi:hypothetical protein